MHKDATALANAIRMGELSASEAMSASLSKFEENDILGSIVYASGEQGLQSAHDIDQKLESGTIGDHQIFCGVPTLAKDLGGPFKGFSIRAGSRITPDNDNLDSDLAARFRAAGFCFFGTTTSPEFGLALSSEPAVGPICRNPLNPDLTAGGSSGGAAAAVASGIVSIAHATDAGGSIRVPAACCGLVGSLPLALSTAIWPKNHPPIRAKSPWSPMPFVALPFLPLFFSLSLQFPSFGLFLLAIARCLAHKIPIESITLLVQGI